MQNEQIREEERDGKAENRIITNNAPSTILYTPDDGNKGQAALTSPTAARIPPHFPCDQGLT